MRHAAIVDHFLALLSLTVLVTLMFIFGMLVGRKSHTAKVATIHYVRVETTLKDTPVVACMPWEEFEKVTHDEH